jgi:hypothetical protein
VICASANPLIFQCPAVLISFLNPHIVKRIGDKDGREDKEGNRQRDVNLPAQNKCKLDSQQAEERVEFDDGVHRNRRSVLEGIADDDFCCQSAQNP